MSVRKLPTRTDGNDVMDGDPVGCSSHPDRDLKTASRRNKKVRWSKRDHQLNEQSEQVEIRRSRKGPAPGIVHQFAQPETIT